MSRYSIPSPIVGGILSAIGAALLIRLGGYRIAMANTAKADFHLLFFACLGLTADLSQLQRAGLA